MLTFNNFEFSLLTVAEKAATYANVDIENYKTLVELEGVKFADDFIHDKLDLLCKKRFDYTPLYEINTLKKRIQPSVNKNPVLLCKIQVNEVDRKAEHWLLYNIDSNSLQIVWCAWSDTAGSVAPDYQELNDELVILYREKIKLLCD